jgi:hypothetical protein
MKARPDKVDEKRVGVPEVEKEPAGRETRCQSGQSLAFLGYALKEDLDPLLMTEAKFD